MSLSGGVQLGDVKIKQRNVTQMAVCMHFVCVCSDIKVSPCGLNLVVVLVIVSSVNTLVHLHSTYHTCLATLILWAQACLLLEIQDFKGAAALSAEAKAMATQADQALSKAQKLRQQVHVVPTTSPWNPNVTIRNSSACLQLQPECLHNC